MQARIGVIVAGIIVLVASLSAAIDGPLSGEVRESNWGISSWAVIRRGQAGVIHAGGGDELRIYLLSSSPGVTVQSRVRSFTPSFSGDYYLVSSYDSGPQNLLGGYFNSFSLSPSAAGATIKRWDDGRRALTLDFLKAGTGFSGMWVHLFDLKKPAAERVYFDSTPFSHLAFWVRGGRGDERILLKASDAAWERKEDALPIGEVADFLPGHKIESGWQAAVVPMKRLPPALDRRQLAGLVFEIAGTGQGCIAIKDLAFSKASQAPPLSPPTAPPSGEVHVERALWVWNTRDILASPDQQRDLVAFCREMRITHLYLQLPNEARNLGASGEIRLEEGVWKPFLQLLNSNGIHPHALDGSKDYALPDWHARVLLTLDNVLRFNRSAGPNQRFWGIHYDIEPYLLEGFLGPRRQAILKGYLQLLQAIATKAHSGGLKFSVDVPFWYDALDEVTGKPFRIEFGGLSKLPSEHVIDLADQVSLMDYRTSAYGADGVIAQAQDELAYATQKGKQVFVGLETTSLPDEDLLDFEGEPVRSMPKDPPAGYSILIAPGGQTTVAYLVSRAQWDGVRRLLLDGGRNPESVFWWPVRKITHVPSHKLTFKSLGVAHLNQTLDEALQELPRYRSFAGFAIHDYPGYRKLLGSKP
ncbi:MAG TPA: hypothetical protein VE398_10015 [Acidobacteriota bacterium]|nr:hypothetical protein [Acidobacteriota bacterium]